MSISNIIYDQPLFDHNLSNEDLQLIFDRLSLIELSSARRGVCTRFRAIADNTVKTKHSRIDLSDYHRHYYEDRIGIFETFGSFFKEITIRYPKDSQLHLKLVRDYSRKTVQSLRLIMTDLTFVNDGWTVSFEELEELTIVHCEARPENISQLLTLCPKLKRFELIWTFKSMPIRGGEFSSYFNEPALYYEHGETGGLVAEKFKEFLNGNRKVTSFHLYKPKANGNLELHQNKFAWKADTNQNESEEIAGTNA